MWRRTLAGMCLGLTVLGLSLGLGGGRPVAADGKIMPPRDYKGSLEEQSQEAIIIFNGSEVGESTEDLVLKIGVRGEAKTFGWVIPFPTEPGIHREDAALFKECYDYVAARTTPKHPESKSNGSKAAQPQAALERPVEVLARKVVGTYDTAVVRENVAGALDKWLDQEGFQTLGKDAEDVVGTYRKKGYVFACIKVKDADGGAAGPVDLHPLRFSFKTKGRDGIYFPMRMTGLQKDPFSVNLYIFYGKWINDKLSKYGYNHRGFSLRFRDYDSSECVPNAGKSWSAPGSDPYLKHYAEKIPTLEKLFQKLHPGAKYYLTNISARNLNPADVRAWSDDLWVFPYYVDRNFVPFDAREGGVAAAGWKD